MRSSDSAVTLRSWWDGGWQRGAASVFERSNPARPGELIAKVESADAAQVEESIQAAAAAAATWGRTPIAERCAVLARAADWLDARCDLIGVELSREEGKVAAEAVGEVRRTVQILRYFAGQSSRAFGELLPTEGFGNQAAVIDCPVGTIGVITPWNFPLAIPAWKIAPALAFGNTVVWKPASHVPLLSARFMEALISSGLPRGVVSMVYARGELASLIARSPLIDAVTFTGSNDVGNRLIALCGQDARPIQAEMGGKNALIVADDADLIRAADALVVGAFSGNGQKCTATARVLVIESVAADFAELVRSRVKALMVGDPLEVRTNVGPVVSEVDQERIQAVLADSQAEGATCLASAAPSADEGWYVAPTVLETDDRTSRLWSQEIFGPVVAMVTVGSLDEAIREANSTEYGLIASVFTQNLRNVQTAVNELEVGMLAINGATTGGYPHVPFGGWKKSGYGPKEQGQAAKEFFSRSKSVYVQSM